MAQGTWIDDGVQVITEVATSGELIENGLQTDIPINAGGAGGVPNGWTYIATSGAPASDVNLTTQTSIFSVSNALATNTLRYYGAYFDFFVDPAMVYRVSFSARVMQGKSDGRRVVNGTWYTSGNVLISTFTISITDMTNFDWVDVTTVNLTPPANAAYMRAAFQVGASLFSALTNWGVQFTGITISMQDPSPEAIVWKDITCDVRNIAIRYGRERFTSRYDVATCSIVLKNDDGEYSFADPHPFGLRPGRPVRVKAIHNATTYPLFYGVIDTILDGYALDGRAISTFTLLDPTTLLSTIQCPAMSTPLYSLLSGDRIRRLLDASGYLPRALDPGQWQTQPIPGSGRNLRDEIGVTADSEGGAVFADRTGQIVYKDRTWVAQDVNLQEVTANLLAMLEDESLPITDDIPTQANAPSICTFKMETDWSRARVINLLELANTGGTSKIYQDLGSQQRNGVMTYQRTDFVLHNTSSNTYGWLDQRAADLMTGYADPALRVNSLAYRPTPISWVWTLTAFLNWVVRVWYSHPMERWGYATVVRIQSIEHRIGLNTWETTLSVDAPMAFFRTDRSATGWDTGLWDDALWDSV